MPIWPQSAEVEVDYDKNGLDRIFTHLCVQRLLWVMSWRRVSQCVPSSPWVSINQRDTGRPSSAERSSMVDWTWDFIMCTCKDISEKKICNKTLREGWKKRSAKVWKFTSFFWNPSLNAYLLSGQIFKCKRPRIWIDTSEHCKNHTWKINQDTGHNHHIRKLMMIKTDFFHIIKNTCLKFVLF